MKIRTNRLTVEASSAPPRGPMDPTGKGPASPTDLLGEASSAVTGPYPGYGEVYDGVEGADHPLATRIWRVQTSGSASEACSLHLSPGIDRREELPNTYTRWCGREVTSSAKV